jgi:D-alanine-D-alanine ligase-like ATP-grasp enzyme
MFEQSYCSDCGAVRVSHSLHKWQGVTDVFVSALEEKTSLLKRLSAPFAGKGADAWLCSLFELLARVHLGTFSDMRGPYDSTRTEALFDGAKTSGVRLRKFTLLGAGGPEVFVAEKDDKKLVFSVMPRPKGFVSPSVEWMDDKGRLKEFLFSRGIPSAAGGMARTERQALEIFERIGPPVITKPRKTSRGIHTTIGINTKEELLRAFRICRQVSLHVIVEKELQGIVHRVTLVGFNVSAVAKRDYPSVISDGHSTVRELLIKENSDPRRDGRAFYKIEANDRADFQLKQQGLTWDSVPEAGSRVILNDKVSRKHGTVIEDLTDQVHPENIALFERIARELGDPLIGMDFMIGDMRKPWHEQPGAGVIECNAMPYIDLHMYPYSGKSRNVASDLWNYVFSEPVK